MCFPGKCGSPHTYSTAQFKLYTHVQVHACACMFNMRKITKMARARTVAYDFVCTCEIHSKHKRYKRDTHYKLALGLPHYTCGVTTGTVAVGNEIQLI